DEAEHDPDQREPGKRAELSIQPPAREETDEGCNDQQAGDGEQIPRGAQPRKLWVRLPRIVHDSAPVKLFTKSLATAVMATLRKPRECRESGCGGQTESRDCKPGAGRKPVERRAPIRWHAAHVVTAACRPAGPTGRPVRHEVSMNIILLALVTVLAAATPSPELDARGGSALKATGGFVGLSVPDAEASARWYVDHLGLKVALRPVTTPDFQVIVLEGRGWMVELVQRRDARPLGVVAPQIRD